MSAYKFIIGASGSGKTTTILKKAIEDSLKNPDKMHLIIVPEQYTMYMQKELVSLHQRHATTNIDVLSFQRLAIKVFKELNFKLPNILDDITKAIILRKVAMDNKSELFLWKNKFSRYGFLENFISLLSELYQYNISSKQFRDIISNKKNINSNILNCKLRELDILYSAFDNFIEGKHILKEEILDILSKKLNKSKLIKGSYIYFDSFAGFAPAQYKIIEILMSCAVETYFTICADNKNIDSLSLEEDDLFYMSMEMAKNINKLADKNMVLQEKSIFLDKTYIESPDLIKLQENFLRENIIKKEKSENIKIISALNSEQEVDFTVSEINNLIKRHNYRYKDIAIISGDLDKYIDKFNIRFAGENIPYHIDSNIKISSNIFIDLISSILELIIKDYNYESIMQFIKNPFIKEYINEYDINSFDNYIYMTGRYSYKKFSKKFSYTPKKYKGSNIERLNNIREFLLEISSDLYNIFNNKEKEAVLNIDALIEEFKNIFNKLDIEKKLDSLSEKFKDLNDEKRAREYENIYDNLLDLFDRLNTLLKGEILKKNEFLELFKAGLSQIEIGFIPSFVDSIFIGDIIRSRVPRVKAIFILGMNEGIIPGVSKKNKLISDREKEFLRKEYDLYFSQTLKQDIFEQKYYLYLALTKSSNKLYITYSNKDDMLQSISASSLLSDIRSLFSDLPIQNIVNSQRINSMSELKNQATKLLREQVKNNKILELFKNIDIKSFEMLEKMSSFEHVDNILGEEISNKLFGEILKLSVSGLEKYAACAYRYFIQYGLNLTKRTKYSIATVDIGNLVHLSLDKIFKDYLIFKKLNKDNSLSKYYQSIKNNIDTIVDDILEKQEENKYIEDAKSQYIKKGVIKLLSSSLKILVYQLESGKFEPEHMEYNFDIRDDNLYDIYLKNDKKIYLNGKIDRIDIFETQKDTDNRKIAIKVLDYKTGNTSWDTKLALSGLQLQLAFYMYICLKIYKNKYKYTKIEPAAILYSNLSEKFIKKSDYLKEYEEQKQYLGRDLNSEEQEKLRKDLLLRLYRPSGIVNSSSDIIKALDNKMYNINFSDKYSDIINAKTKAIVENDVVKAWELELKSDIIPKDKIDNLLELVNLKIKELSQNINKGDISINPVDEEKFSCKYCQYKSICGFDKNIKGYKYRYLSDIENNLEV